jgi:hypothetical protein
VERFKKIGCFTEALPTHVTKIDTLTNHIPVNYSVKFPEFQNRPELPFPTFQIQSLEFAIIGPLI